MLYNIYSGFVPKKRTHYFVELIIIVIFGLPNDCMVSILQVWYNIINVLTP